MSIPIPLRVVLSSPAGSADVTKDIRDLKLRWSDPGGFASCEVSLDRPLATQPSEIMHYASLTVWDARNATVAWDGRLEDPGRSAGGDGQVWKIAAIGGQAHTKDEIKPRFYIDNTLDFARVYTTLQGGEFEITEDPGEAVGPDGNVKQAVLLRFPIGTVVTDHRVQVRYDRPRRANVNIARLDYSWDGGVNDAAYGLTIYFSKGAIGGGFSRPATVTHPVTQAGGDPAAITIASPIAGNQMDSFDLRFFKVTLGAHTIPNDLYWVSVKDIVVVASRYDMDGAFISGSAPYAVNYVLPHEVVKDLLGRHMPELEGDHRTVDTDSAQQIKQLAYMDGADVQTVLNDLMMLDAGYTWRVWERGTKVTTMSTSARGRFKFEWQHIPRTVRYEADLSDGYESTASADGLYNQVSVRWTDTAGRVQSTLVTNTVPILTDAGLIRRGQIDLGNEAGEYTAAQQAGEQWLIDRAQPANAGRLRIARPIRDIEAGRMVMPWEIRPGLIRVRGILPRPDAINTTTRDGVSVFRIVACEYSASDGTATLELDSYPPSLAHLLAASLYRRPTTPGRIRPFPIRGPVKQ